MLEIIAIVALYRHLAAQCLARGRSAAWAVSGPLFWLTGELCGAIVAAIGGAEDILQALPAILGGAALGAVLSIALVRNLENVGASARPGTEPATA